MNPDVLVMVLLGAGVGLGVLVMINGFGPAPEPGEAAPLLRLRLGSAGTMRVAGAIGAALAVLVVTRWVAVAVATAVTVLVWPWLFGGARGQKTAIARLEALAAWIESVRDTVATGTALPEALPASAASAHPLIAPALWDLVDRMRAREPLDAALLEFADQLDDPTADEVIAALHLTMRTQGVQLKAVLSALATATRQQLQVRRQVEAERRSARRAQRVILGLFAAMVCGQLARNGGYVRP
ncbi:MAG: type II secretion system F family protein, partial [Sporichthyaceae bacterium]|nr:type II secretion system F family protein [Sporichthyaceae bacterium]